MAERYLREIEERLSDIPQGRLLTKKHAPGRDAPLLSTKAAACSDGRGLVESWAVFPGVVFTHSLYRAERCAFHQAPRGCAMQINHCRYGRAGWEMRGGAGVYLGPGDLSLHRMDACAQSFMELPLGCYEGVAATLDLDALEREPPAILREAGVDVRRLCDRFCARGGCAAMPANPRIDHIFSELYALPRHLQLPWFRLKVQELLLFLSMLERSTEKRPNQYRSQQIELIQSVHRQLTEHLDRRFTIEELSKQYLINTSSLKAVFKSVYGAPIAAYMREYRIRRAAQLLRETEDSIADVAAQVGYENQSKFTAAFKAVFQVLPTAYRRQYQA